MLQTLKIKNIAVIDQVEVPFEQGLNILSGETGAGKSIVIEAISLILGSRATAELVRAGCEEGSVEGMFDTAQIPWIRERLERLGFESGSDELLIRRVIHRAGKHRIYINGSLATLSILQEICDGLVDLCGQHEHQSLTRPAKQLELLDRYGGTADKSRGFESKWQDYQALVKERDLLASAEAERTRQGDFLKFQIQELREADLKAGEDATLQEEKQLLQSVEQRAALAQAASSSLEGDEDGVIQRLKLAQSKVRQLIALDASASPLADTLERAIAEAEESASLIERYLRGNEQDPGRLEEVQGRLSKIADLRRKYGTTVDEMIATLARLETEESGLEGASRRISELEEQAQELGAALIKQARALSSDRKKAAQLLGQSVTAELKDLKMGDAKVSLEITSTDSLEEMSPHGGDALQLVVQTNRGEAARPIGKIASGGELSRIMLAIRRVIADRGGIGVYLFDEIDAGIGGQTAFQVGKKLKSVASYNQVICITHLPQVASFADHHLVVRKRGKGERTLTEVTPLGQKERKEELARMLGGPELTKKSLDNAAELLSLAR